MKRTQLLIAAILAIVAAALLAVLLTAAPTKGPDTAQKEKKEVTVWVNTRSGVYHCPGTRWYGKTKQGKYMGECQAIKDGNRPAYGKPCGSPCE